MNKVILVGAGSVCGLPHIMDCPVIVVDHDRISHCQRDLESVRIDRIEIPLMPEPFSGSISGYLINEDVLTELRRLADLLSISMTEVVDAVRNLEKHTYRASIDIVSLTQELAKTYIEQDYEYAQAKSICTKPFKSKIKKSQYAASSYQRSGFQATRKLARGRI